MKRIIQASIIVALLVFICYITWCMFFENKGEAKTNTSGKRQAELIQINNLHDLYPNAPDKGQIVEYSGFTLLYNEKNEQPEWVIYLLTKKHLQNSKIKRSDKFVEDKHITTGSATPKDYSHSGYDKGHMCPAADMGWDKEAMRECFYMSNMSPQEPGFNRGVWKELEEKVRNWAIANDSLIVVTGPVLNGHLKHIGRDSVSVPKYYYKVIFDISYPTYKTIGFIMKNEKSDKDIFSYAVTVDSVEKFTNIDFFPNRKDIERLEQQLNIVDWE